MSKVKYAGTVPQAIMNQADYFYYSGHGLHMFAMVDNYSPEDVAGYWKKDLDCVIFAGCSVLDINDYNNHFALDPEDHVASPGRKWAKTGPSVFLGYNHKAPLDSSGAPAKIASAWVSNRTSMGDVDAWMKANDNMRGRNACAILRIGQTAVEYQYFKGAKHTIGGYHLFNTYKRTSEILEVK